EFIRPPTPPPDIDIEAWESSIDLVAGLDPSRLGLTHFGAVDEPASHLERMKQRLREQAELVRRLIEQLGGTGEAAAVFVDETNRLTRESCDPETTAVFEQGAPRKQLWSGLLRYWQKQGV